MTIKDLITIYESKKAQYGENAYNIFQTYSQKQKNSTKQIFL